MKDFQSNLINATFKYLESLDVNVSIDYLSECMLSCSRYPSVFTLTSTLNVYGLDSVAMELEKVAIEDISNSFIALYDLPGGQDFIFVRSVSESEVVFNSKDSKPHFVSINEFLKNWTGVIVIAETKEISSEPNLKKESHKTRFNEEALLHIAVISALALLIGFRFLNQSPPTAFLTFLGLSCLGLFIPIMLIKREIGMGSSVLDKVCKLKKQMDCEVVLSSKGNKIGFLKLTDLAFLFFISTTLPLLMPIVPPVDACTISAFFYIASSAIIPYSLYYQGLKLKQWCMVCLIIVGIILLGTIFSINFFRQTPYIGLSITHGLLILFCVVTAFIFLRVFRSSLSSKIHAGQFEIKYKRQLLDKYNFFARLNISYKVDLPREDLYLSVGNPAASNVITKVCNPFCPGCSISHLSLMYLVDRHPDLKVHIVYNISEYSSPEAIDVINFFLSVQDLGDGKKLRKVLDDWYSMENKSFETLVKINQDVVTSVHSSKLEGMEAWCKKVNIEYTPTLFLNGVFLPSIYSSSDIMHILLKNKNENIVSQLSIMRK